MPRMVACPQCRAHVPWEGNPHRPFCSERCRMLDLGTWLGEGYRVPGEEREVADENPDAETTPDDDERS